jgi:hypothetical protein
MVLKRKSTKNKSKYPKPFAGQYDELLDVEMYIHDGYDQDGLDLWLQNWGSKAENFHQKMKVGAGPHDI